MAQTGSFHTDWIAFGFSGFTHYRIWTMFDGRASWQRHEWKRDDGTARLDAWAHSPCPPELVSAFIPTTPDAA